MGAINDYAAALGRESRGKLQGWIDRLRRDQVEITLLITLLDPFSDPRMLAEAIWEEWGLGGERAILLLLVREADSWRFHYKAGRELAEQLRVYPMGEYRRHVEELLGERRVGRAALAAVKGLLDMLGGPPEDLSAGAAGPKIASPALWYVVGGFFIALLMGLIWALRVRLCPRCGGRLRRDAAALGPSYARLAGRGGRERVYYCSRCGYLRVLRGGR